MICRYHCIYQTESVSVLLKDPPEKMEVPAGTMYSIQEGEVDERGSLPDTAPLSQIIRPEEQGQSGAAANSGRLVKLWEFWVEADFSFARDRGLSGVNDLRTVVEQVMAEQLTRLERRVRSLETGSPRGLLLGSASLCCPFPSIKAMAFFAHSLALRRKTICLVIASLLVIVTQREGPLFLQLGRFSTAVTRFAQSTEEESRLDPVAGKGELPEWLMEATGGVPKERQTEGVDFGWDYRVVGAVIFALGLLYVGFQG
eukprot:s306_g10.t1